MDAARELPELLERHGQPSLAPVRISGDLGGVRPRLRLRQPQRQRERHETLLGAVVEVPLEPPALLVRGGNHSGHVTFAELVFLPFSLGHVHAGDEDKAGGDRRRVAGSCTSIRR